MQGYEALKPLFPITDTIMWTKDEGHTAISNNELYEEWKKNNL